MGTTGPPLGWCGGSFPEGVMSQREFEGEEESGR